MKYDKAMDSATPRKRGGMSELTEKLREALRRIEALSYPLACKDGVCEKQWQDCGECHIKIAKQALKESEGE